MCLAAVWFAFFHAYAVGAAASWSSRGDSLFIQLGDVLSPTQCHTPARPLPSVELRATAVVDAYGILPLYINPSLPLSAFSARSTDPVVNSMTLLPIPFFRRSNTSTNPKFLRSIFHVLFAASGGLWSGKKEIGHFACVRA